MVANVTNIVALATTFFVVVANLLLDFTQTSSPDGKCDSIYLQYEAPRLIIFVVLDF